MYTKSAHVAVANQEALELQQNYAVNLDARRVIYRIEDSSYRATAGAGAGR